MINKTNLNKGRRKDKKYRYTPHSKLEAVGVATEILDRYGNKIVTGDKVLLVNSGIEGVVLYNRYSNQFEVFYGYSTWNGNNIYNLDNYRNSIGIPTDNGMRMEIEVLKQE